MESPSTLSFAMFEYDIYRYRTNDDIILRTNSCKFESGVERRKKRAPRRSRARVRERARATSTSASTLRVPKRNEVFNAKSILVARIKY